MKPSSLSIPLLLGLVSDLAGAARLNIRGRPRSSSASSGLVRRASIVGSTSVSDVGDVEYVTNIQLGGKTFNVQIDTGRYVFLFLEVSTAINESTARTCGW